MKTLPIYQSIYLSHAVLIHLFISLSLSLSLSHSLSPSLISNFPLYLSIRLDMKQLFFTGTSCSRHWPPCQCAQNWIYVLQPNGQHYHTVSSTEKDIDTRLMKAWTAIDRLSIIWKSDLTDEMKRSFFQAAVVSILLYGCTTWTLTKWLEKKLDGNYTRMLRAILNKSWRQHPTRRQLYGHLPPITKTIQVRRARHAGHCWRSKDELVSDVLLWTPTHGQAKAGRPAQTYIQQLCGDTGYNPEDLPEAMNDREK